MRKNLIIFILAVVSLPICRADILVVNNFSPIGESNDKTLVKDMNDDPCAVIRIAGFDGDLQFGGNVTKVEQIGNEYTVNMVGGSRSMIIFHPKTLPLTLYFNDFGVKYLKSRHVFSANISLNESASMPINKPLQTYLQNKYFEETERELLEFFKVFSKMEDKRPRNPILLRMVKIYEDYCSHITESNQEHLKTAWGMYKRLYEYKPTVAKPDKLMSQYQYHPSQNGFMNWKEALQELGCYKDRDNPKVSKLDYINSETRTFYIENSPKNTPIFNLLYEFRKCDDSDYSYYDKYPKCSSKYHAEYSYMDEMYNAHTNDRIRLKYKDDYIRIDIYLEGMSDNYKKIAAYSIGQQLISLCEAANLPNVEF